MVNLFINIYNDISEERAKELSECLRKNAKVFDKVVAINNTKNAVKGIVNVMAGNRPTFKDFFNLVNTHSNEDDINVISNSDILFTSDGIKRMTGIGENECYALSRYNGNALFLRSDSQDCWVFRGWIKHVAAANLYMGLPGSDNSIADRLYKSGYTVTNPCFSIKTHHLHQSNVRNYSTCNPTPMPYRDVYPTDISGSRRFYVTSINPYDRLKQQLAAIKTWKRGVVVSFNTAKEIKDLGDIDGVTFVELRDGDVVEGKYPRITAITKWAKYLDFDRFILINSDIAIRDMTLFNRSLLSPNFVIGVRHDDGKTAFPHGYDVFALNKDHINLLNDEGYALGLPWWDFYVPMVMITKGIEVDVVRNISVFTHEWHETRYDYNKWINMGEYFKSSSAFYSFTRGYSTISDMCTETKKFIDSKMKVVA